MSVKSPDYAGKIQPKILVVDDRPSNLVAIQKILKNVNAQIITAESGNDALKLMLEHEFTLALLDVQMPEMDGYELAELMRCDQDTAEIPIIFVSAIYTDKLNIFKGYEKGAFSFITKPFEPHELLTKIHFFIEKYHTEKAFDDSQKKYMDLYNNSPDMLISVDMATNTIIECNKTLEIHTGFSRSQLIGSSVFDIYSKDSVKIAQNAYKRFNEGEEKIINLELNIVGNDGIELPVLLNATGLKDLHGKIIYSNSSLRDITELKKTKKELETTLEKLQLYNKELENFVYLTSHDLQEPMLTVMSFIQLLQDEYKEQLDQTANDYISYSLHAAKRLKELITALLNYLRVGRDENKTEVDLNELIEELLEELRGSIRKNNAEITVNNLPKIFINSNEMKHLFQNLISNAIKFKKKDSVPKITISAKDESNHWLFSIEDNGIGIEEKNFEKVFQIFKQLHVRGKYSGMGVGMAVCKKIVELHGGKIWLESKLNLGTTFYFTLPK